MTNIDNSYIYLNDYYDELIHTSFESTKDLWQYIMNSKTALNAIDKSRVPTICAIIEEGQREGIFSNMYPAAEIAEMIVLTNHGLFQRYMNEPESINYTHMAMEAVKRLAYSYLTTKGRASIPEEYIPGVSSEMDSSSEESVTNMQNCESNSV